MNTKRRIFNPAGFTPLYGGLAKLVAKIAPKNMRIGGGVWGHRGVEGREKQEGQKYRTAAVNTAVSGDE